MCRVEGLGHANLLKPLIGRKRLGGINIKVGSIPHPVMGTTRDYCRYIKSLTPY